MLHTTSGAVSRRQASTFSVIHWKAMLHAAISDAAAQGPLPYFEKAFVEIEIVTPRGSNNARVWDTSNRALQVILNNLKGIFFHDDDMEHMAFSVAG